MSMLRLYETLYQGHPLGVSGLGYMDSILSITQDDLYAFYRDHYHPAGAIMTIVGAVKAEEAIAQVEKHLGGWQGHGERQEPLFPQVTRPQSVVASEIRIPGKTQADLALGTVSLLRKSPDFLAARLANSILGVFGMMGRVGDNVRERQGLAYYAYTSLVAGEVPGPWMAIAGVSPDNIPRAVVAIVDEIRRLQDELVPDQELAENKAHLTGSMPLALETNAGMASTLQAMEVYDLGHDYLERYPAMIEAISAADVQRIARQYLDPEAYVLSVAKPTE